MPPENKFHDDDIQVQILKPPFFEPTRIVVNRRDAWQKHEWIGTFNLWIVQSKSIPSIIYQLRGPTIGWAPDKLDVAVGGHYENLEKIEGGIREVNEEIGKNYLPNDLTFLGRRLYVGVGQDQVVRQNIVDIYLTEDNLELNTFNLQKKELYALFSIPIVNLLNLYSGKFDTFSVTGIKADNTPIEYEVNKNSFPPNFDPYHYKMALLIDRYFKGERNLMY